MPQPRLLFVLTIALIGGFAAYFYTTMIPDTSTPLGNGSPIDSSPPPTTSTTAIVIGAGLAGLSAASTLLTLGVSVVLLEKGARAGGNSVKASSGINGVPSPNKSLSTDSYEADTSDGDAVDSVDLFYADMKASAGGAMHEFHAEREALMRKVTRESGDAITWLAAKGVDLRRVSRLGGHTKARTHRGAGGTPPGWDIVSHLVEEVKGKQGVELRTGCEVLSLLMEKNDDGGRKVRGVKYRSPTGEEVHAYGPVVITAGGFAGDEVELRGHRPDLADFPSTNEHRSGAVGLLRDVDALMVDMHRVQVHPTGFIDPVISQARVKFLAAEMLRGEGGILLRGGKRFVDEMATREVVTRAITQGEAMEGRVRQCDVQILLDGGAYQAARSHVDFYLSKGLMKKRTLSALAPEVQHTLAAYSKIASGNQTDPLGRTHFGNWALTNPAPDSVVYIGDVTPVVHFSMGGALINERAEVLGRDGKWIEGLWGAGEVTGGLHGENRLGGSSLLECVVFGRVAGGRVGAWIHGEGE